MVEEPERLLKGVKKLVRKCKFDISFFAKIFVFPKFARNSSKRLIFQAAAIFVNFRMYFLKVCESDYHENEKTKFCVSNLQDLY